MKPEHLNPERLIGNTIKRSQLRSSHDDAKPWLHAGGVDHDHAWHRREHRDLQRGEYGSAAAAAVQESRYARGDLGETGKRRSGVAFVAGFLDWRERNQSFDEMAVARRDNVNLTGAGEPERLLARMITANFFSTLGVEPQLGRSFTDEEERVKAPVVVISDGLWKRRFGRDADAGRQADQALRLELHGHRRAARELSVLHAGRCIHPDKLHARPLETSSRRARRSDRRWPLEAGHHVGAGPGGFGWHRRSARAAVSEDEQHCPSENQIDLPGHGRRRSLVVAGAVGGRQLCAFDRLRKRRESFACAGGRAREEKSRFVQRSAPAGGESSGNCSRKASRCLSPEERLDCCWQCGERICFSLPFR